MIILSPSLEGSAQRHTVGADILALIGRTLGYEPNDTRPTPFIESCGVPSDQDRLSGEGSHHIQSVRRLSMASLLLFLLQPRPMAATVLAFLYTDLARWKLCSTPSGAAAGGAPAQPSMQISAPLVDSFVGNQDTAGHHQCLNLAHAQREVMILRQAAADDLHRVAVPLCTTTVLASTNPV
jgi:hypothetical protein